MIATKRSRDKGAKEQRGQGAKGESLPPLCPFAPLVSSHDAVVSPRPLGADIEFFDAAWRRFRIMQSLFVEDDSQLAQQFLEACASVRQARELHSIFVHVPHNCFLAVHDKLSQGLQFSNLAPEELNQLAGIFNRAGIDNHCEQSLTFWPL